MTRFFATSFRLALCAITPILAASPTAAQAGGVDTVGRAVAKKFARLGRLPDPSTIEVADLINYHRHGIPLPKSGEKVALDLRWDAPLPARLGESVLQIGIATPFVHDASHLPPLDLAIVIDRSGSMAEGGKMDRVKQALGRFVASLRPQDRLALVAYSTEAEVVRESAPVDDGRAVREAIQRLRPGGNTNLHAGLMCGYSQVRGAANEGGSSRVILLTDGLANTGVTDTEQIARESGMHNAKGIDLSTIGVGLDFNHALLEQLAQAGRGSFHFVADQQDIEKVFVAEAQSLMGIVARDVRLEVKSTGGIEFVRIYGDGAGTMGAFDLDDFNYGMTRVVLIKMRGVAERRHGPIEVTLHWRDAKTGVMQCERQTTSFADPTQAPTTDHEVRKNFTIAVMARALRRMAEAGKAERMREAERVLTQALEFAKLHYPNTRDEDIVSIRSMLEKYQKNLCARIESFRDL